MTFLLKTNCE